jgi:teichuronic acid biosynthesis glycosyltransferase TuaG
VATRPLVSVFTPTYNGEAFVAETIESVFAQSYTPIEHVLIDDASTDRTPAILEDYAARHPDRIRVLRHTERAGPCRRRNEAIAAARGEYLAWLDHDDVWLPEKIERQAEALGRDPQAAVVYTQYEIFDHDTGRTSSSSKLEDDGDLLGQLFLKSAFFASSTALIRREAMARGGIRLREADFSWGDDLFLWLELSLDWHGVLVDEVLARLRQHRSNESVRIARTNPYPRTIRLLHEFLQVHPEAVERLGADRRRGIARHHALGAIYELERDRKGRAAAYAARAAVRDPAGAARYVARRVTRPARERLRASRDGGSSTRRR